MNPASVAVIVLAAVPVYWRRNHPGWALIGCLGSLFLLESVIEIYQTIPFPSMVAGYALARVIPRRSAIWVGVALMPLILLNLAVVTPHTRTPSGPWRRSRTWRSWRSQWCSGSPRGSGATTSSS